MVLSPKLQTKTAKKAIPYAATQTYIAYMRPPPPPRAKNPLQIMSLTAITQVRLIIYIQGSLMTPFVSLQNDVLDRLLFRHHCPVLENRRECGYY